MKNKKLIATVASLCLVLVAVVAAVIGVLAAAQQNVSGKFKVTYQANDVSAIVKLQSQIQPLTGSFDKSAGWSAANTEATQREFLKQDSEHSATKQNVVELSIADQSLSSSQNYIVYKFTFTNTSTMYDMKVTPTYTAATAGDQNANIDNVDLNVSVRWQRLASANESSLVLPSYLSEAISNADGEGSIGKTMAQLESNFTVPANKNSQDNTMNLYIVVAITNLNGDAHYYLGGTNQNSLSFLLERA